MKILQTPMQLIVGAVLLFACGCRSETDVTNDPRFRDGWTPGGEYVLLKDVELDPSGALVPTGNSREWLDTVLKANREAWKDYVVGPVYAGTHLRLSRLTWERSFENEIVRAYAKILEGEFAGREVGLALIDHSAPPKPHEDCPGYEVLNPKYLRLVPPGK